jgi:hypothetical protein
VITYIFGYKLKDNTEWEVEIEAKNYYEACDKFDDYKKEKKLEITDLKYRVIDSYSKGERTRSKNKYVLINMETLRVDLIRSKTELEKELAPLDIADTTVSKNGTELLNDLKEIIEDYIENDKF